MSGATIPDHVPAALVRDFDYHTDEAFLSDPFAGWDKARELRVFWSTAYDGYWVLTHLEDIRAVYQDSDLYSSKVIGIPAGRYPRTLRPLALDPPEHGVYRQVLAAAFSPNAATRMSGDVRKRCRSLIDQFRGGRFLRVRRSVLPPVPHDHLRRHARSARRGGVEARTLEPRPHPCLRGPRRPADRRAEHRAIPRSGRRRAAGTVVGRRRRCALGPGARQRVRTSADPRRDRRLRVPALHGRARHGHRGEHVRVPHAGIAAGPPTSTRGRSGDHPPGGRRTPPPRTPS